MSHGTQNVLAEKGELMTYERLCTIFSYHGGKVWRFENWYYLLRVWRAIDLESESVAWRDD